MNREQLLEKLAMELDLWPATAQQAKDDLPRRFVLRGKVVFWPLETGGYFFHRKEWLAERERLINKPSWDEAPGWATSLLQQDSGDWYWCEGSAEMRGDGWHIFSGQWCMASRGDIPAGHNWRATLEECPVTTSPGASSTACDDQFAPDPTAEEEEAFRACEQRIRDAELRDIFSKQARYQDAKGEDWIDEFARTSTMDEFRGAMRFTIGKYNRRAGKKDELIKEITKMEDYCRRWREYEQQFVNEQDA